MSVVTVGENAESVTHRCLIDTVATPHNFEEVWALVEEIVITVLNWDYTFLSPQRMTDIVTKAYILVYHLSSHPCLNAPKGYQGAEQTQQILAIHDKLKHILHVHLSSTVMPAFQVALDNGDSAVTTYTRFWKSYLVAIANIDTIFSNLGPTLREIDFNPLESTEDAAFSVWSTVILTAEIADLLVNNLIEMVTIEREMGLLAAPQRPEVTEIRDSLGRLPDQSFYNMLEERYVSNMRQYYSMIAGKLQQGGVYEYARMCIDEISAEQIRARRYCRSPGAVTHLLVEVFVDEKIDFFHSSDLVKWLTTQDSSEAREKLRHIYQLLSKSLHYGLPLLLKCFSQSITLVTSREVRSASSSIPLSGRVESTYDSVIKSFLTVAKNTKQLVMDSFSTDERMVEAMENGLRQGLIEGGQNTVNYCALAERLAQLPICLTKQEEEEEDSSLSAEEIVSMYFFLPASDPPAKDAFLVAYQARLAHRLLSGADVRGEQYTMKLLGALKTSLVLFNCRSMIKSIEKVETSSALPGGRDVAVSPFFLRKSIWPSPPPLRMKVPDFLMELISEGTAKLKAERFAGRHIVFAPAYSFGTVQMQLPRAPCPVVLQLSLLQMSIALTFNTEAATTVARLSDAAESPQLEVVNALAPFVTAGILECHGPLLQTTSEVWLSTAFKSSYTPIMRLIPEFQHQLKSTHPTDACETSGCHGASPADRVPEMAIESHIASFLKRADAPQSLDDIHRYVSGAVHPRECTRVELKRGIERLIQRDFIVRDAESKGYLYNP